jgi:hypothetical protein
LGGLPSHRADQRGWSRCHRSSSSWRARPQVSPSSMS